MTSSIALVLFIVGVALLFDFVNGFHDSANSIATVVGTRVLSPGIAVLWAAFFNFFAAFVISTGVAKSISKGIVLPAVVAGDPNLILGALIGAITWNLITWWLGLPTSSSHAIVGGFGGAAVAKAGIGALVAAGWIKIIIFIFLSPLVGMTAALFLTSGVGWLVHRLPAAPVERAFRRLQLVSAAAFSVSHGGNDAQKTMGIIVALLVATQDRFVGQTGWIRFFHVETAEKIPYWVEIAAYSAIALGTAMGGWRIVKTMGTRITKLRPFGGFCAETGGAGAIFLATALGVPVSTTHTITGAIVGVGAANRLSAVRWGIAGRIVWAWLITIPMAGSMAGLAYVILR
ncbi:MAG TPA: inorganic phosphate transporter [Gemmatimonadales bacterium]|jgi:PiT family inorganic phosphate transporter|nr:inorganic phosphate transporter [Gemmatimonadales bacterium]